MVSRFGIHPGDDALVGETVIPGIVHVDDQVFVDLDADDSGRADNFAGNGDVIGGWFEIIRGVIVAKDHCCRICQNGGLQNFTRMNGAEDKATHRDTMFSPIISFLALSRSTTNCSRSGCPLVKIRF
jgi:hypothetical protein